MSWRIATDHRSVYRYTKPVIASYNEVRITPASFDRQAVIETSVTVNPPTTMFTYFDYWTSIVVAFDVEEPHSELTIAGSSIVNTSGPSPTPRTLGWTALLDNRVQDGFAELLVPTSNTTIDEELTAIARQLGSEGDPRETLDAIAGWVRASLDYRPGTTDVSTSAIEAWRRRSGVCQDFAHVTLTLLREIGIPARYVSGYLHPNENAAVGDATAGASHAWVEAWIGHWSALDPTSGSEVGERHVTVARGRDYRDVAPFRGIYHGGALDQLDVSVTLTRLS